MKRGLNDMQFRSGRIQVVLGRNFSSSTAALFEIDATASSAHAQSGQLHAVRLWFWEVYSCHQRRWCNNAVPLHPKTWDQAPTQPPKDVLLHQTSVRIWNSRQGRVQTC